MARPNTTRPPQGAGPTPVTQGDPVAEALGYLPDAAYPAVREQLVAWARGRAAPSLVLMRLQALPERRYDHEGHLVDALRRQPSDPRDAFELPLLEYDDMTVEEITHALDELAERHVRRIYDHERQTKNRLTILHACEHRLHKKMSPPPR